MQAWTSGDGPHRGADQGGGGTDRRAGTSRRLSNENDVARWFEQAPPVELLVNNAGLQGAMVTFDEEEPESWWHVLEIDRKRWIGDRSHNPHVGVRVAPPPAPPPASASTTPSAAFDEWLPTTARPSPSDHTVAPPPDLPVRRALWLVRKPVSGA